MKLRIATRRSALALTQTRMIASQVSALNPDLEVEEVQIITQGDRIQDIPLSQIGGKGLFVSEVEEAIIQGRADLAVHSLKDVPAELAPGLKLVCVPPREDPRDVLVTLDGCKLDDLEAGSSVGTSSLRRRIQLGRVRSDLAYTDLRGNVDTRLRKLEQGQYSAIVLAYAGLRRLALDNRPLWPIPINIAIPAVGQGTLALEGRQGDSTVQQLLQPLEDSEARASVVAERTFLKILGGDCNVPLAGHLQFHKQSARLRFDAMVGSVSDGQQLRASTEYYMTDNLESLESEAEKIGEEVARTLLSQGADLLIREARELAPKQGDPRYKPRAN